MKRVERNQQSKDEILQAAIEEFGSKGYSGASLNAAIQKNGISKGLIYHYFENKDSLYLACVKACFDELTRFLEQPDYDVLEDIKACLQEYFSRLLLFFKRNPDFSRIFFEALMQPPGHLYADISLLKKDYNALNLRLIRFRIKSMKLRANVTIQEAIDYYLLFLEAFNYDFCRKSGSSLSADKLIELHDIKFRKTLDIMLHGLVLED